VAPPWISDNLKQKPKKIEYEFGFQQKTEFNVEPERELAIGYPSAMSVCLAMCPIPISGHRIPIVPASMRRP
jgi:hypothetical protein